MKKAIVLPHHVFEKMQSLIQTDNGLTSEEKSNNSSKEKELTAITESHLPADEKALLYQEALFKLLRSTRESKKDIEIPIVESVSHQVSSSSTQLENHLYNILPLTQKRYGVALYRLLQDRCKDLVWNDNGVISFQGNTILGSNIVDIIINLLSQSKQSMKTVPIGFNVLKNCIRNANIPNNLIKNKERLRELQQQSLSIKTPVTGYVTPFSNMPPLSAATSKGPSSSTPRSSLPTAVRRSARIRQRPYIPASLVQRWKKL